MADPTQPQSSQHWGDVLAEHLIETYGIVPYVLPNGTLGLHFMALSASIETEGSLHSEVTDCLGATSSDWREQMSRTLRAEVTRLEEIT